MQDSVAPDENTPARRREFAGRALALAALYALAVLFAVVFSPSAGVTPVQPSQADNLAASPAASAH